jgi:type II secretory pathway pseudopilin PulG
MKLAGQATTQATRQAGYAMAVLLVAMSVMAVMLSVAMPVWRQASQREKEEELVFRGLQYTHAIGLFQRKYANAFPPNFDVLVNEKFLRKKFKDPITAEDFVPILAGQSPAAGSTQAGRGAPGGTGATGMAPTQPAAQAGGPGRPATGGPGSGPVGGIVGVTSKSKDKSIRLYNGRSHYNEWQFVYTPQLQAPGAGGAPGAGVPGQRGGQQGQNPLNPGGGIGGRGGRGGPGTGRPGGPGGPGRGFNPFGNPGVQPITPPPPRGGRSGD